MARPLRIEYEGAAYHIISRGNRGEHIFEADKDKEYFLEILQAAIVKYKIDLYAYCIMGNHYHLLLTTPYGELTKAMHYIGSAYGSYLRRQKGWIGHIFAGRYKSLCIEKERYLLELSRYIHLNPVRAGITENPEGYKWSSYVYYIGKGKKPEWLNTDWLLAGYGRGRESAWKNYKEFVKAGIGKPIEYSKEDITGQAIMGSKEFIKKVIKGIKGDRRYEDITEKRSYEKGIDLEELRDIICRYYKVKELTDITIPEDRHGRLMFIYLSKKETSALNKEIADMTGGNSPSGVTHQYKRILKRLEENRRLKKEWEKETRSIMSMFKGRPQELS
jgi:REP element-mobilizing transposase RayT